MIEICTLFINYIDHHEERKSVTKIKTLLVADTLLDLVEYGKCSKIELDVKTKMLYILF